MKDWNWTPKAYRVRDNVMALGCLAVSSGMIVWIFYLATN